MKKADRYLEGEDEIPAKEKELTFFSLSTVLLVTQPVILAYPDICHVDMYV